MVSPDAQTAQQGRTRVPSKKLLVWMVGVSLLTFVALKRVESGDIALPTRRAS